MTDGHDKHSGLDLVSNMFEDPGPLPFSTERTAGDDEHGDEYDPWEAAGSWAADELGLGGDAPLGEQPHTWADAGWTGLNSPPDAIESPRTVRLSAAVATLYRRGWPRVLATGVAVVVVVVVAGHLLHGLTHPSGTAKPVNMNASHRSASTAPVRHPAPRHVAQPAPPASRRPTQRPLVLVRHRHPVRRHPLRTVRRRGVRRPTLRPARHPSVAPASVASSVNGVPATSGAAPETSAPVTSAPAPVASAPAPETSTARSPAAPLTRPAPAPTRRAQAPAARTVPAQAQNHTHASAAAPRGPAPEFDFEANG
jgi:hypothetical protein